MTYFDAILTGLGLATSAIIAAMFVFVLTLNPCPTEDSSYCYWNAEQRSNGKGISFIALHDGFIIPTGGK